MTNSLLPVEGGNEGLGAPAALAERFHDLYERLAPAFGYETREDTKHFDPGSPNGRLMTAVCTEILAECRRFKVGRYVMEWLDEDYIRITWRDQSTVLSYEVCGPDLEGVLSFGLEAARRGAEVAHRLLTARGAA